MAIGPTVFLAQWNALPEARCFLQVGRDIVSKALCGSYAKTTQASDDGTFEAIVASVKILKADWPSRVTVKGERVKFSRSEDGPWDSARVGAYSETDGVYSLNLEAEFV